MRNIIQESFGLNLSAMKILHLYFTQKPKHLYKVSVYFVYFLITTPVPSLGIINLFLKEEPDLMRMADNAFVLSALACNAIKYFPFVKNDEQIKKCIHYFEFSFTSLKDHQKKIIEECIWICRRNTRVFVIGVIFSIGTWAVKPLIWTKYKLPIDVWLPFNPTSGPIIHLIVYIYLVIGTGYSAFSSGIIDPLIAGLACHAAGQVTVLRDNLQNLTYDTKELLINKSVKNFEVLFSNILYDKIKECILHHNDILNFVKEYERCFTTVVFSQFAGSVLEICFCLLQISKVGPSNIVFFLFCAYLAVLTAQVYFYCYYGSMLLEETNALTDAVYMSNWYEYDLKSRKALSVLMERTRKPMIITAGKIFDVSLQTFTTIIRRSYSLLAVLNNYE